MRRAICEKLRHLFKITNLFFVVHGLRQNSIQYKKREERVSRLHIKKRYKKSLTYNMSLNIEKKTQARCINFICIFIFYFIYIFFFKYVK